MDFEWDEKKRLTNVAKHGLDFRDGPRLFRGPVVTWLVARFDYGEPRYIATVLLMERVVVPVYTERPRGIRLISMRKANRHEETRYFESLLEYEGEETETLED